MISSAGRPAYLPFNAMRLEYSTANQRQPKQCFCEYVGVHTIAVGFEPPTASPRSTTPTLPHAASPLSDGKKWGTLSDSSARCPSLVSRRRLAGGTHVGGRSAAAVSRCPAAACSGTSHHRHDTHSWESCWWHKVGLCAVVLASHYTHGNGCEHTRSTWLLHTGSSSLGPASAGTASQEEMPSTLVATRAQCSTTRVQTQL